MRDSSNEVDGSSNFSFIYLTPIMTESGLETLSFSGWLTLALETAKERRSVTIEPDVKEKEEEKTLVSVYLLCVAKSQTLT